MESQKEAVILVQQRRKGEKKTTDRFSRGETSESGGAKSRLPLCHTDRQKEKKRWSGLLVERVDLFLWKLKEWASGVS